MKRLELPQWVGILLAGGGAAIAMLAVALTNAQTQIALSTPVKWLLLAGIGGLLGGSALVQFTWKAQQGRA